MDNYFKPHNYKRLEFESFIHPIFRPLYLHDWPISKGTSKTCTVHIHKLKTFAVGCFKNNFTLNFV